MKISIIVPVYKVEKYIDQCINSVLNQTYQTWELILVDDGSPDRCPQICEEWCERDPRIRVIHQENAGVSVARNSGMRMVTGDYVMFLDSDDFWNGENCLEILVERLQAKQPDVLTFRFKKYIEATEKYIDCFLSYDEEDITGCVSKNEKCRRLMEKGLYLSAATNKVVKTEFLQSKQLYFREGITSEDIDWCARILLYAQDIQYCDIDCYVYRQRECSITHNLKFKNIEDLKNNIIECLRLGEMIDWNDEFYGIYHTFVAYQYGVFLCTNTMVKDKRIDNIVEEMKQYQWLLNYHSNRKIKLLYYVNKFWSYNNLIRCMRVYARIRRG